MKKTAVNNTIMKHLNQNKMTAVEWLAEQFDSIVELYPSQFESINNAIQQAKEMDKQQKIEDYRSGRTDQQSDKTGKSYNRRAEQYYNETYNK